MRQSDERQDGQSPHDDQESLEMNRPDEERHAYERQHQSKTENQVDPDVQLVDWDGPDDPANPFNWPKRKKIILTVISLVGTFTVLLNGTAITVAATTINEEFGISDASFPNSYWPVTSWTLGGALFMMVFLPLMEDLGVRVGYMITYAAFLLFVMAQALSNSFATLIIVRFFAGGCVSTIANSVSSMICDIWVGEKARSAPIIAYVGVYLLGSTFGPVFGAAVFQFLPWRWILWIQLIIYAILFPVFVVIIQETRGSVILRERARIIRRKTGRKAYTYDELHGPRLGEVLKVSVQRPLYMLCTEFVVFTFTLWSAFSVGLVYVFTQSVGQVYASLYSWPAYSTGYVQSAIVLGELVGWAISFYSERLHFASAKRNKEDPGHPIPEARLYIAIPAALIGMTAGMFVYAWTSYPFIHWIWPSVGLFLVGIGITIVVIAIAAYVMDCYSKYAASAVAAVACGENVFSAFLPLAAQSMYTNLGFRWASSLLAFLSLALALAPVVLLVWGRRVRQRSPFISEARYEVKAQQQEEKEQHQQQGDGIVDSGERTQEREKVRSAADAAV